MSELSAIRVEDDRAWRRKVVWAILALTVLRLIWLALDLVPIHFDEAQYWTYGEAFDYGYYSKPPLTAWVIRVSTEILGVTTFGARVFSPLCHAFIAWLCFATARRLFDARTGFWAGLGYALMPGVSASSGLITTDPVMMVGWAIGLYGLVRALVDGGLGWWALMGAGLGAGMMAKYTGIGLAGGCLGYALFSRKGGFAVAGPIVALIFAGLVLAPNLLWNANNNFATISHVGDNARLDGPLFHPGKMAEFAGAQFAVFGPIFLIALIWLLARRKDWRGDWRYRLMLWLAVPLPLLMTLQAFLSRAHPNWAAPAYIAGAIIVAAWLVKAESNAMLKIHAWLGVVAAALIWGAGGAYGFYAQDLPRGPDPFKKMRYGPGFCAEALGWMTKLDVRLLMSDDRRLLAECAFMADMRPERLRVWNPTGRTTNHYELAYSLPAREAAPMILALKRRDAADILPAFDRMELLAEGEIRTHADRSTPYGVWRVEGFRGYGAD